MGKTRLRRVKPRLFLLDCGHFTFYRASYPANGTIVYCRKCDDDKSVKGPYQEIIGEEITKAQGRVTA